MWPAARSRSIGRRITESNGSSSIGKRMTEVESNSVAMNPQLRIAVVTLFPELIDAAVRYGITGRALDAAIWRLWCVNPRDFATDNYRTIDDRPYGGGPGMVMLAGPLERALDAVAQSGGSKRIIYLSPQGRKLDHSRVMEFSREDSVTLLCGRYEGGDERLLARRVDE